MTELYWITRLPGLGFVACLVLVIAIIVAFVACLSFYGTLDNYDEEEHEKVVRVNKKYFGKWLTAVLLSLSFIIFVPSQKEMLLIYGLGNTIDYIKSNEKAKELPDKVVDALTKYLETLSEEEKK